MQHMDDIQKERSYVQWSDGGTLQDKNDDFARIVSVTAHFCQFSPGWNQSGILSPD